MAKQTRNKILSVILALVVIATGAVCSFSQSVEAKQIDCPNCINGYVSCPNKNCKGGYVKCSACKGEGGLYGAMNLYRPCAHCGGTGSVPCTVCHTTGQVKCTRCNGNGTINDGTPNYTVTTSQNNQQTTEAPTTQPTTKATPDETSISNLTAIKNGFEVEWEEQAENTTGYQIQCALDDEFCSDASTYTISNNKTTSLTVDDLYANKKYFVRIRTYRKQSDKKYYSSWSKAKTVVTLGSSKTTEETSAKETTKKSVAKPKATSLSKLTAKDNGFKVTWEKQTKNTTGYQVQYATNSSFSSGKQTVTISGNKNTSKTINNLKEKKKYFVRIRTYRSVDGVKYYSSWSKSKSIVTKTVAKPDAISISKLSAKDNSFTVRWEKQTKNTTGYQIQYATDSAFTENKKTKTVSSNKTTSLTVDSLKSKTKYYVRIRAFRSIEDTKYYSSWSKAKIVTTKTFTNPDPTKILEIYDYCDGLFSINFKPVKNCKGYQLQISEYSDFRDGKQTIIKTCPLNGTDHPYLDDDAFYWYFDDSDQYEVYNWYESAFKTNVKYYFRMRTYKESNGKKVYSDWSNVKSAISEAVDY